MDKEKDTGKEKTGLVLEGGAMRGLYTMGILDVFLQHDILVDGVVGVSAGAAFGCNYKSHQAGRVLRYNLNYSGNWRFKGFRSLITTGDLFGADFCYNKIPNELDVFDKETFASDPMEFWAVVTDCDTGSPVYKKLTEGGDNDMPWIQASASMPLASRPVKIGGKRYLDGGLSDSIPLEFMEKQGFTRNIVILTQPRDYVKSPYSKTVVKTLKLQGLPKISDLLAGRHVMYNMQTAYVKAAETQGSAYVLAPPEPLDISPLEKDPAQLQRVYDAGKALAEQKLTEILEFLAR